MENYILRGIKKLSQSYIIDSIFYAINWTENSVWITIIMTGNIFIYQIILHKPSDTSILSTLQYFLKNIKTFDPSCRLCIKVVINLLLIKGRQLYHRNCTPVHASHLYDIIFCALITFMPIKHKENVTCWAFCWPVYKSARS